MGGWKLCLVLLLPLTVCEDGGETFQKTLGKEADVTPICTNETTSIITLIVCKIRTERSRGEECHLLYRYEHGFENECDSRFTLMMKNQTVFLHLINLTPADSGNYSCECSQLGGTYTVHLNVTVEVSEDKSLSHTSTDMTLPVALSGVTVLIIVTLIILGCFHRKLRHRKPPESLSSPPVLVSHDIEPYSTYRRTDSGLYSTVKLPLK